MDITDTIVAVSSPPGRSPRGLVRLAGPGALAVLEALVEGADPRPRLVRRGRLRGPSLPPLPILYTCFRGPASYSGDDVAELQCPGHPALLERILARACQAGARLAEPGEFTYRAYVAGKLDLTQAEGIAATISALSDSQLAAAAHLRQGELARFAQRCVDRLGSVLALVEAGIDFVDQEDVVPIAPPELAAALDELEKELQGLLGRSRSWGAVEALPRVVLAGSPSAGKSTLFNALLGRTRSVVDALPGTTRDVLEEPLRLPDGGEVMLVDLAGLEDAAATPLDAQVQRRAADAIASADLVLHLDDTPLPPGLSATVRRVRTKCDLIPADMQHTSDPLHVSGVTGQGLDALREAVAAALGERCVSLRADLLALQPRHTAALHAAVAALHEAGDHFDPRGHRLDDVELVAASLRAALDALAALGGRLTPDDVIGRVFATFCVGK